MKRKPDAHVGAILHVTAYEGCKALKGFTECALPGPITDTRLRHLMETLNESFGTDGANFRQFGFARVLKAEVRANGRVVARWQHPDRRLVR